MKDKHLLYLWECNRDKPGWLSQIIKYLDPTNKQVDYIQEIDDEFQRQKREGPPHCGRAISETIKEVPLELRREMRLRYLRGSQDRLKERLSDIRGEARGLQGNREFEEQLLFAVTGSRLLTDELWKTGEEIERLTTMPKDTEFHLMPDQIERARSFPLWKLLGKRELERIPCPYHNGKDKNMQIGRIALCHVCGARADSIKWLMDFKDLKFREAVEELS